VIICQKCAKENQDHYKFCLGCGAELPKDGAPKAFAPTTPQGTKQPAAAPVSAAPVAPPVVAVPVIAQTTASPVSQAVPSGKVACPQCGHANTVGNLFCGSCGFRLSSAAAPMPSAAPPAVASQPQPSGGGKKVVLTALRADGTEAGTYALPSDNVTLGRESGGIFAADSYLSPKHATFRLTNGQLFIKDEASLNGVYRKLTRDKPVELKASDVFRIGQEILRFEPLDKPAVSPDGVERLGAPAKGYIGRVALVVGRETTGNAFPVPETGIHLGRERGEVLFPEDGYVSGLHCQISMNAGRIYLTDLGSSNGTFMRLKEEVEVTTGDILLMGQQLFRIAM
jgi:pSer/pThr/pTyr-binding forkhead associated (FHA) protein